MDLSWATEVWANIAVWLAGGGVVTVIVTALFVLRSLAKNGKISRAEVASMLDKRLNEWFLKLSFDKPTLASLENLSKAEFKQIKKDFVKMVQDELGDIEELKDEVKVLNEFVKVLLAAIASFKSLPNEQVANINAVLGKVNPGVVIAIAPMEKLDESNTAVAGVKANPFA